MSELFAEVDAELAAAYAEQIAADRAAFFSPSPPRPPVEDNGDEDDGDEDEENDEDENDDECDGDDD
jgi:hypothetical protein